MLIKDVFLFNVHLVKALQWGAFRRAVEVDGTLFFAGQMWWLQGGAQWALGQGGGQMCWLQLHVRTLGRWQQRRG